MPKTVEALGFDTKLFGFQTGRILLEDKDISTLDRSPDLIDVLKNAYSVGYKLLYLLAPSRSVASENHQVDTNDKPYPGTLVDLKTTYELSLSSLDMGKLCEKAFKNTQVQIKSHDLSKGVEPSLQLLNLAVVSGSFSRFKIDTRIPHAGYESLFNTWLRNSFNRSVADEIFIAYERETSREVGFVTVKCKDSQVNIGLLAVDSSCRRMGIASALLSRAALWALERVGHSAQAGLNVVTQGENHAACQCYERFGFAKQVVQEVFHIWLPEDLPGPVSQADQSLVPFCRQHFTGREMGYVQQLLEGGIDSVGRYNLACSSLIQAKLGEDSTRVLVVPSGTAALELAALLCDLQAGDEVLLPSYTFASTANAFVLRGAVPVFIDVRVDTLNIDESKIEEAVTERTKAICAVHYGGVPCEMDTICNIARKYNLKVIEDAAQGYLSKYKGRAVGSMGDFGCFSFHYTKNIVCGEGGAISINRSAEMARRAMVMWEKGTNRYDFMMGKVSKYEWIDVGSSFVPSELSCAFLQAQLESSDGITKTRLQHYERYQAGLQGFEKKGLFTLCAVPAECQTNAHIFFLLFRDVDIREKYQEELKLKGIAAFTHYIPLHSAPAGKKYGRVGSKEGVLPVTDKVHARLLRLPIWRDLKNEQIDHVIDTIKDITSRL